jgi:hypothetical protein
MAISKQPTPRRLRLAFAPFLGVIVVLLCDQPSKGTNDILE